MRDNIAASRGRKLLACKTVPEASRLKALFTWEDRFEALCGELSRLQAQMASMIAFRSDLPRLISVSNLAEKIRDVAAKFEEIKGEGIRQFGEGGSGGVAAGNAAAVHAVPRAGQVAGTSGA